MKKAVIVGVSPLLLMLGACAPSPQYAPITTPMSPPAAVVSPPARPLVPALRAAPVPGRTPGASGLTPPLLYHILLAEIAGQRGRLGVAAKNYLVAARESNAPRVAERATRIALYAHDDARALAAARRWAALAPGNMDAQQVVAALLLRAGKTDQALVHLERMIAAGTPRGYKGYRRVIGLLSREKDKQTAMAVMRTLVARHPHDSAALYALSHLAMLTGRYAEAHRVVDKVIALRPGWTQAYILRASILARGGDKTGALVSLREAVSHYPDKQDLRLYYARKLIDARRLPAARAQFSILLKRAPKNAEALFALGLLDMQSGKLSPAEGYFERLAHTGARVDEVGFFLGQIKEAEKQPKAALRWYRRVRGGRYFIDARIRMAMLMASAGDLAGAQAQLQAIEPRTIRQQQKLYLAKGALLSVAKHYQGAFDLYSEALTQLPNDPGLLYARSLVAERLNKLDVVESDLKRILARDPNNVQALNALGYTLADRTRRYKTALGYIERALEQQPDDPAILDSMGWVQYRLGHYAKAVKYLRKAYAKMKDAEIGAHLGEVLWVVGKRQAARKIWNEALRSAPDDSALRKVIHRFAP